MAFFTLKFRPDILARHLQYNPNEFTTMRTEIKGNPGDMTVIDGSIWVLAGINTRGGQGLTPLGMCCLYDDLTGYTSDELFHILADIGFSSCSLHAHHLVRTSLQPDMLRIEHRPFPVAGIHPPVLLSTFGNWRDATFPSYECLSWLIGQTITSEAELLTLLTFLSDAWFGYGFSYDSCKRELLLQNPDKILENQLLTRALVENPSFSSYLRVSTDTLTIFVFPARFSTSGGA